VAALQPTPASTAGDVARVTRGPPHRVLRGRARLRPPGRTGFASANAFVPWFLPTASRRTPVVGLGGDCPSYLSHPLRFFSRALQRGFQLRSRRQPGGPTQSALGGAEFLLVVRIPAARTPGVGGEHRRPAQWLDLARSQSPVLLRFKQRDCDHHRVWHAKQQAGARLEPRPKPDNGENIAKRRVRSSICSVRAGWDDPKSIRIVSGQSPTIGRAAQPPGGSSPVGSDCGQSKRGFSEAEYASECSSGCSSAQHPAGDSLGPIINRFRRFRQKAIAARMKFWYSFDNNAH